MTSRKATSRSRLYFRALLSALALVLLSGAVLVGYRTWQVEAARRSLENRNIEVSFTNVGPHWLREVLPEEVANAWTSTTSIKTWCCAIPGRGFYDVLWKEALPDLRKLPDVVGISILGSMIDHQTVESFNEFKELRNVAFDLRKLDDQDIAPLRHCTQLTSLSLVDSQMTDKGLETIAELRQLQRLTVSGTEISERGLAQLSQLTNLRVLNLDHSDVSERGFDQLKKLTKLTDLSLVDTGLPESVLMPLEVDRPGLMISDD